MSTPKRLRASSARQTGIGSCFPFAATGSCGSNAIAASAERIVAASTMTAPTGAAPCRRAAVLTTSPVTMPSPRSGRAPSATTASPVVTAARTATRGPSLQLLDRLQDPQRGPHSPLGVVLVRDRSAEDRHDGVADELLDRAAEALDVGLHALVVRTQCRADVLGSARSERSVKPTRSTKSTETTFRSSPAGRLRDERLPAREAEACPLRVLLAAGRADDHARIFAAAEWRLRGGGSPGSSSSAGSCPPRAAAGGRSASRTPTRRASSSTTGMLSGPPPRGTGTRPRAGRLGRSCCSAARRSRAGSSWSGQHRRNRASR